MMRVVVIRIGGFRNKNENMNREHKAGWLSGEGLLVVEEPEAEYFAFAIL
jgi:hypothetical protein